MQQQEDGDGSWIAVDQMTMKQHYVGDKEQWKVPLRNVNSVCNAITYSMTLHSMTRLRQVTVESNIVQQRKGITYASTSPVMVDTKMARSCHAWAVTP